MVVAHDGVAHFARVHGLVVHRTGNVSGTFGNAAEVLLDELFGLGHIDVTRDAEGGVVGHVELLVEGLEFLGLRSVQVLHAADGGPAVRVLGVGAVHGLGNQVAVRLVVDAQALFFFHDLALGLDAVDVHLGVQHALRLQPQAEFELVGRQQLVVEGAVVGGVGVEHTTRVFDVARELAAADVFGAFKEQVLKEVRHAGAVGVFVFGTHVVHDGHGHNGGGMVFVQDHVHSVFQVVLLEGDLRCLGDGKHGHQESCAQKAQTLEVHNRGIWVPKNSEPRPLPNPFSARGFQKKWKPEVNFSSGRVVVLLPAH